MWHAGTFLIINGFFWVLDAITGNGITWAVWISLMWGLALAYHALACYVDGRGTEAAAVETFTEHRSSDHHTV